MKRCFKREWTIIWLLAVDKVELLPSWLKAEHCRIGLKHGGNLICNSLAKAWPNLSLSFDEKPIKLVNKKLVSSSNESLQIIFIHHAIGSQVFYVSFIEVTPDNFIPLSTFPLSVKIESFAIFPGSWRKLKWCLAFLKSRS